MNLKNIHITVVGLGYVGLPLAVAFGEKYPTLGFDIDKKRIEELKLGHDRTGEVEPLKNGIWADNLIFNYQLKKPIANSQQSKAIYIITVPTPIDEYKKPDLKPLLAASKMVGSVLKFGDIVIYESTVYPGCTEHDCIPVLEQASGLKFNQDFFCGYSPERINPGDKERPLKKILKITAGSTPETAQLVNNLYGSIIDAGTYQAPSIQVAEAAKLIENCQRDVNIAFVNELVLIFDKMGLDVNEVLEAASTKWNFLNFKPGLVGGHCIGIDPYYMIHQAQTLGYTPKIIEAGRAINNYMPIFVANQVIKNMITTNKTVLGGRCLLLGFSYKPNVSDFRNTKVIDLYNELKSFGLEVDIYDPIVDKTAVEKNYRIKLIETIEEYDEIVLVVSHDVFKHIAYDFKVF